MTKIEIKLNDGTSLNMEIDDYNADTIAEKINDSSVQAIVIGDAVLQRYSIIQVMPLREDAGNE